MSKGLGKMVFSPLGLLDWGEPPLECVGTAVPPTRRPAH
jgi:hypothetical protein